MDENTFEAIIQHIAREITFRSKEIFKAKLANTEVALLDFAVMISAHDKSVSRSAFLVGGTFDPEEKDNDFLKKMLMNCVLSHQNAFDTTLQVLGKHLLDEKLKEIALDKLAEQLEEAEEESAH